MARELPITEFDMLTVHESLQMFKAMIPFLEYDIQKPLSMIIRINELTQTMNFYNNPRNRTTLKSQSLSRPYISNINDIFRNEDFLNTVIRYCPEKYAGMIDNFRNFSKMSDIMNIFNASDDGSDLLNNPIILEMMNNIGGTDKKSEAPKGSPNMQNLFGAFLTPEQKSQYDDYMKKLSDL